MRAYIRSTLLLASLALSTFAAQAAEPGRTVVTVKDADYFGFDLRTVQNVTLDQCGTECVDDQSCKAFTYNTKAKWCFLKSDFNKMNPFPGAVAGKVVAQQVQEPDLGAPQALSFLTEQHLNDARRQRLDLAIAPEQQGMGIQSLLDLARHNVTAGTIDQALIAYKGALSISPDDSAIWIEMAIAANRVAGNYSINAEGLAAAVNAYETSRTKSVRAQTLAVLARSLEATQNFRAGINAYKASLKLVDDPTVQAAYQDLRYRQGFRVVNNSVDSDSATPRACIQFSEPLVKAGVDYTSYVTLNGAAPKAIEAKGSEICVEGLVHGERYKLAMRAGLPSSVDEPLLDQVDLEVYVKDRAPTVRFTGDSFVLPSTARRGIPLVSINSDNAQLKLYRIGDRAIASFLGSSQFLTQLDGWRSSQIESEQGELVWSGSIDIKTELNKEVVTSFPVDEALPERKPGVYVLTAASKQANVNDWDTKATQWFVVSDIGISTYAGTDGLNVFVRSLATAKPMANVTLQLLAKNNEILGTTTTDSNGRALLSAGLMRGSAAMTPAVLTAQDGAKDYVFLDMTRAGFDLSDRGVTGRTAPGAIDVLAWTERGIYRAGETVHVAALARDIAGQAIDKLPLTFVFLRPDGVEDRRIVTDGGNLGGHTLDLPLQQSAMRGSWTMRVYTDPKEAAISEKQFQVDDFVPDRIEFDLTSKAKDIEPGLPAEVDVDGRFLYGAPAAGLELEGDIALKPTRERAEYKGYVFGLTDEEAQEETRVALENLAPLDENGKAAIAIDLPQLPSTTQFLEAKVVVRMKEAGGRAVERDITLPINTGDAMIGIKPEFSGDLAENSIANFHVIGLDGKGERQAMTGLRWKLLSVERNYQWYRDGSSWRYEPVLSTKQVSDGTFDLTPDGAKVSTPVNWGRYRLEVESLAGDGPTSSVEFDAGWYVQATSTETPDGLEIGFDKENYKIGETARLKISPRFAGEAVINVGTESLIASINASVGKEGAVIDVPVTAEWGAGAYVTATLFRPGDAQESRLPMRAIGLKWVAVDPGENKLAVDLTVPEKTLPRQPLDIQVAVQGAGANEEAYVTVAAVDVGILNLTRYEPADPEGWYFGQRQLGLEIRDLYGRLIDGSLGATGRLRTGGDGAEAPLQGNPPTEKLVAFFSGPVKLDAQGKATVSFDIPQFNGTARVMSVAWTKSGLGHAVKDVVVRDPVVVTASLPKFLAPGDTAELRLDIANTDAPAGDYQLALSSNDRVLIDQSQGARTVKLDPGSKSDLTLPIKGGLAGDGNITVMLTGANGFSISQQLNLNVRPSTLPMTERRLVRIDPGRSLLVDSQLMANSIMQGASISVNMTQLAAFDIPALLMTLDRYPYGCAEQTTSRALPLLYLSELAIQSGVPDDGEVKKRVQDAVYRVLSYQSSSGSFGLWGPGSGDFWLDAYVTDFLTRAREQKFDVPDTAMVSALDNLENQLGYDSNVADRGNEMAYALYVLARNRRAAISDLRYYADTMLDRFPTQLAKAHIAASLALYGDRQRSERIFADAARMSSMLVNVSLARSDYGSTLRDDAAILALAAESRPQSAIIPELAALVAKEWERTTWTSTQEQAWLVLAARALKNADQDIRVSVNDVLKTGGYQTRMSGDDLLAQPVNIVNQANEPVTAVITTVASPKDPLTAGGDGFDIARSYYTLDGEEANVSEVKQNERYVVVLKVKQENDWSSRLMIADLLPAGFEIDNPGLVNSAAIANFDWLPETQAAHLEFRYDRFLAAIDNPPGNSSEITLAYVVRAVNPGTYDHPAASVEDMYRPQFSARTATGKMRVVKD
ncbi:alpha-2-macroglobulin family protein [Rhizobium sp. KVB221]|uniref:Alpha-2-macroglobulin family protein n=1 Tax=Rhizobium setariae TaxID=2801340 RepID=A0A936YQ99_9HYPH|nr:alpha-2-macroglobulin family protein [Rhizobium setariae]MBL0372521.1 alpha-2-macroglobulin family protein [Rhizobium setariae]